MNLAATAMAIFLLSACSGDSFKVNIDADIRLNELYDNCKSEIEKHSPFPGSSVIESRILAWYRVKDDRPLYLDNAICWARLDSSTGKKWALVHMARNPHPDNSPYEKSWKIYTVEDVPEQSLFYYNKPPGNKAIASLRLFHFRQESRWELYDSGIYPDNWRYALKENPEKHQEF